VHTRSLHAEESAFLQITKYGGTGIKGGKLFTTASPCELCSKKAYQLGISIIYYIDPYPGISQEQILNVGDKHPTVRLFNGAIGNAYNWLYEPLMNYKDEQSLIFGTDIKDLTSKQKEIIKDQEAEILQLKAQVEDLLSQKL
jgi:tRNA(Arg) A34 adenosine deaminase TadA